MRKLKLFLSLLMLFAFSLGNVWAATAEFSYSDLSGQGTSGSGADFTGATKGDVFMSGKGNGNTSYVQIYANGTLTFTPLNGATITKIVLEATTSGYVKTWSSSPEGVSVSDKYVTWEGSSTSVVTLTNTASGQARIKKMTVTYTEGSGTPTCATPTFSPAAGSYEGTQNVTISSTAGATIYYTTDGSTPSTSSSVYSSPIAVSADMTIKAYAVKADYDDSEVATAAYTITEGPDVTIDLLDEGWGFPTSKVINETSYTNGSYTIKVAGTSGNGFRTYGTYFLLGQSGAYIELPVFTSPIAKIVVAGNSNGSGNVAWNIYQGENAVSTAASGCKNDAYTFEIAAANQKANVAHTIKVTSAANLQIKNIKIYFGEAAAVDAPTISGETPFVGSTEVTITAEGADAIYYTLDGTDPTVNSTKYTDAFTLDATKTVKAIAVKGSNASAVASKEFTKVVSYTTIADIYTKAVEVGSTATDIYVTFNNWIVTGVKNSNVYLTDGTNGLIIYGSGHNFEAVDILSGTAACKVQLYNGNAELTSLTASTAGLTVTKGGVAAVNALDTDGIAALTAKNTGSVIKISGEYTSDGKIAGVKVWNNLYSFSLTVGTSYECTGVYFNGGETHGNEIMPRSADDIVVVAAATLEEVTGLAALKAADRGSYIVNLTDAVVTLVDGNNAFIEDATAGALIYFSGHGFAAGDKLNGQYEVTTTTYQGKFEITAMTAQEGANKVADAEIPVTTLTIAELDANFAANESKRIKIVGVDVTDAIGNNDRNGQISDGTNTFALYAGKNGIAAAENDNVDIIGYPTFYNDAHQFNVWAQTDITVNEKVTVRFLAPVDWENVYAYTFTWDEVNGTTEYDGAWPGKQLTKDGDWYAVNVPVDAKVIFHNNLGGDANQTVDIVADESKCYIWKGFAESGKMDVLAVEGCEMKYYIAGTTTLTGQDWQHIALNEGNTITFSNVAAGDHQFKITNGTWDWNIGRTYASATGVTLWTEGDNVGFTTDKVMNITISYNPATEQITVAAEEVVAQAWSTVKFKAAGSDFAIKENVPQGQAYTIDLAETPWRPGYNFAGWSASEIASASEFTTPLTTITPDADEVTLYAVFSKEITPGSANYVKVTATEDITDGQYLIVYEDENVAFNGGLETLDASGNTIGVEIEEDKIASNTTTDAAAFTIDVTNGTVKSASNLYIGVSSNSNGLKQTDDAATYTHNFSIDADKNAVITAAFEASTMTLRYNSATGQLRFRYYKNAGQQAIQLYKKVATPGTYSYTTDPATIYHIAGTPALTGEGTADAWAHKALGEGNTITFDNVEAGEYKFKITDGTWSWSKGDAAVDKTNSSGVTFSETDGDGNVVFSIASETSVTITYDAANDKILVVAPIVRNYHIAGSEALTGQDWQHIALTEGNSITFNNVAAGDYEFKITDGTWDWYVSYAAENVDSENSNVTISESESNSNFKFTLAAKSNVTIAYNEETGKVTVNAEAIPEPKNVVILAEYNSKFCAMTNSLSNGALAAVEVEKDNDKIVVFAEADKDAIQWTATTDGNNTTTLKDANDKYIKGSSGASLSLDEAAYNWNWDSEKSCYISSEYTNRGLFFNNSGVFKGYATSNLTNDAYAATEVIEIAAENIILSTKVDPQLAFNPEEVTLTVGDEFVAPVLGSVEGFDGLADVTLESSNISLAVVNEGVVSLVENATGTATITATFAGNSNYLAGTASYTITVNEVGDDLSGSWVLATAVPAVGQKVIIAATYQNETKAMGIQNSNNRAAVASTLEDDVLTPGVGTKVFTLVDAGDGKFAIQASNGNYLSAAGTGTSNHLKEAENFDEDNAKWTITIENGEANIVASSNNRNVLRYNSGNTIFSCYQSGAQRAINIYVQDTYTRPLEPNRYYTVCLPKKMMEVRGASFWTLSSRNTAETEAYLEEVDPTTAEAGTPFIIQATDTKLEVVYTGAATATAGTNGALHGTLTYMDADALAAAGSNIYMLYNNALRPVGNNNHLDANRAYIDYDALNPVTEAPQPAPGRRVRAVPMQQNTATGIDELNGSEAPVKVLINGQLFILRGEKMYDAKGLLVK